MKKQFKLVPLLVSACWLTACSDDGENGAAGQDGSNSLVAISALAIGSEQCPLGGKMVTTGLDINGNGNLDDNEVDSAQTQYLCNQTSNKLTAELIGRFQSDIYGLSAAEIVDFHSQSKRIFVVNAQSGKVDVLDGSSLNVDDGVSGAGALALNNVSKLSELDVSGDLALERLGGVNSLSIYEDLLAVAVERGDTAGNSKQGAGYIAFYRLDDSGEAMLEQQVEVGALPDNVVFNRDGTLLLVANEGEPNSAYDADPEGSISLIEIANGIPETEAMSLNFKDFNLGGSRQDEVSAMIKLNGPGATVAQDLEPEYIAVSEDNTKAFVSLQENNAIAVINLVDKNIEALLPLGLKNYGLENNKIDASDKDDRVNFVAYQDVYGMYQPDTIQSYQWQGANFIVTANEGDARDYDGFSEEARADDLTLDLMHPQLAAAQDKTQLGRLKVTTSLGDTDNDGDFDQIVSYGARSFSIWDAQGNQVFDSASDFSRITAAILGNDFNNSNDENKGDSRSDDKAGEPEALAIGRIGDVTYAFIGLERNGGFMIYDISNPFNVSFVDYIVNRDFSADFEINTDTGEVTGDASLAGDLGPEGMKFVTAQNSPTGEPILIIGNEVSGTTSVYALGL
ncbi:choice-of-anchor I family protein [Shewanella pneumatophori]|uniref:Choice-of-anchor I family protein n=1 Tax=Shewanella pneumatophori TaxID=314092 RepID=A0A9X1ZJD9_9GAMM|nr:choice-of-anchor I family protein [Shewanella pneumatophori]MCL1137121.1 choice-of-anchor I family protein [Shewanella pneumatophori]